MSHFKTGDKVRRRSGTLGASGETGVVLGTNNRNGFELVTVRFQGRTETFHWDVYEHDEISASNLVMPSAHTPAHCDDPNNCPYPVCIADGHCESSPPLAVSPAENKIP